MRSSARGNFTKYYHFATFKSINNSRINVAAFFVTPFWRTDNIIEIEFFQLYQDQPIFQDIVSFLIENGFQFIDFTNLQRWGRYEHSQVGQCVFCDGLFLRTPENFLNFLESLDSTTKTHKAAKYIAILAIYNRSDLINIFIEKGGQKFLSAQQLKHTESIINILKKNQRRIEYSVGLFNNLIKLIHPRLQLKIFI